MSSNTLAELTDIAMRIKESLEDQDIERFASLFHPDARINSMGRFYTLKDFLVLLRDLVGHLEQPALDILQIQESQIGDDQAFVSFLVESGWIDAKTWEERTQRVTMSLQLANERDRKGGWLLTGFTLAHVPEAVKDWDGGIKFPGADQPPPPRTFGLDSLFSFWY